MCGIGTLLPAAVFQASGLQKIEFKNWGSEWVRLSCSPSLWKTRSLVQSPLHSRHLKLVPLGTADAMVPRGVGSGHKAALDGHQRGRPGPNEELSFSDLCFQDILLRGEVNLLPVLALPRSFKKGSLPVLTELSR